MGVGRVISSRGPTSEAPAWLASRGKIISDLAALLTTQDNLFQFSIFSFSNFIEFGRPS